MSSCHCLVRPWLTFDDDTMRYFAVDELIVESNGNAHTIHGRQPKSNALRTFRTESPYSAHISIPFLLAIRLRLIYSDRCCYFHIEFTSCPCRIQNHITLSANIQWLLLANSPGQAKRTGLAQSKEHCIIGIINTIRLIRFRKISVRAPWNIPSR